MRILLWKIAIKRIATTKIEVLLSKFISIFKIAKAILDILTSGKEPAQIRDQIVAVLSTFHTANISLDSEIVQPGYTRTLRQCLNIDDYLVFV